MGAVARSTAEGSTWESSPLSNLARPSPDGESLGSTSCYRLHQSRRVANHRKRRTVTHKPSIKQEHDVSMLKSEMPRAGYQQEQRQSKSKGVPASQCNHFDHRDGVWLLSVSISLFSFAKYTGSTAVQPSGSSSANETSMNRGL